MTGLELSFRNSIVKSTEKGSSNTLYMDIQKGTVNNFYKKKLSIKLQYSFYLLQISRQNIYLCPQFISHELSDIMLYNYIVYILLKLLSPAKKETRHQSMSTSLHYICF